MKKSELLRVIQEAILEGVMDNTVTKHSRNIVNHLKKEHSLGGKPLSFFSHANNTVVSVRYIYGAESLGVNGGNFKPENKIISINVQVPDQWDEKQLNQFIPKLKHLLAHELEHLQQSKRKGEVHHTPPGYEGITYNGFDAAFAYLSIDSAIGYFMSPHEIEAWVVGSYKEAKTSKRPLLSVLAERAERIKKEMLKSGYLPQDEVENFIEALKEAWIQYAENRFPGLKSPGFGAN